MPFKASSESPYQIKLDLFENVGYLFRLHDMFHYTIASSDVNLEKTDDTMNIYLSVFISILLHEIVNRVCLFSIK